MHPVFIARRQNLLGHIRKLEREAETIFDDCIKIIEELDKLTQIKNETGAIRLKKIWASIYGKPLGVLKLVSSNVPAVPPLYVFVEDESITFGKAKKCDIVIGSKECSKLYATVRGDITWTITNHNPKHLLYVNEKYCANGWRRLVRSGDRIQFGENENLKVIYEFQLYSKKAFSNKLEAQSFFESQLKKCQQKADNVDDACNQLKTKLQILNETCLDEPAASQMEKDETKNTTEVKKEGGPSESKKIKIEPEESKDILDKTLAVNYVKCEISDVKLQTELPVVDNELEIPVGKMPVVDAKVVKIKREP